MVVLVMVQEVLLRVDAIVVIGTVLRELMLMLLQMLMLVVVVAKVATTTVVVVKVIVGVHLPERIRLS